MNISIALPAMAPQPTGHPASLPPDPVQQELAQKVTQMQSATGSQDAQSHTRSESGEKQTAPPSAMQLKIMQILEQQAEEMDHSTDS